MTPGEKGLRVLQEIEASRRSRLSSRAAAALRFVSEYRHEQLLTGVVALLDFNPKKIVRNLQGFKSGLDLLGANLPVPRPRGIWLYGSRGLG